MEADLVFGRMDVDVDHFIGNFQEERHRRVAPFFHERAIRAFDGGADGGVGDVAAIDEGIDVARGALFVPRLGKISAGDHAVDGGVFIGGVEVVVDLAAHHCEDAVFEVVDLGQVELGLAVAAQSKAYIGAAQAHAHEHLGDVA